MKGDSALQKTLSVINVRHLGHLMWSTTLAVTLWRNNKQKMEKQLRSLLNFAYDVFCWSVLAWPSKPVMCLEVKVGLKKKNACFNMSVLWNGEF